MFTEASFWKCFSLMAVGTLVGVIFVTIIFILIRCSENKKRYLELDFVTCGVIPLAISVFILIFTWPIEHWFEIILIGFGLSGFALRWIGVSLSIFVEKRSDFITDWSLFLIAFLAPTLVVSLLAGIVNHIWLHAI